MALSTVKRGDPRVRCKRLAQPRVASTQFPQEPGLFFGLRGPPHGGGARYSLPAPDTTLPKPPPISTRKVTDPGQMGYSLANVAELLTACLDAAGARSVLEVGAFRGELTTVLLEWAAERDGATIAAVEPLPPTELLTLTSAHPELELIRATSHEVLAEREIPDAIVLDGDHNYYTLSEELRLIAERAPGAEAPLILMHDMCWPHARRDTYYAPERIPESERQPLANNVTIAPDEPGLASRGLPYVWAAQREGGDRNGVLTATEDFIASHDGMRLAVIPAFFGFGVLWSTDSEWSGRVAELVDPWDRNPVLERLEANRVDNLVRAYGVESLWEKNERQEEVLRAMLASNAFALAERLSRIRMRGKVNFSREQVRRALGDPDP